MQTIILKVLYLDFHFVLILDFSEVAWLYLGSKFGKKKKCLDLPRNRKFMPSSLLNFTFELKLLLGLFFLK